MSLMDELLAFYEMFPFHKHPFWLAVVNGDLSREQIVKAECQHYLRTKSGQSLRREALNDAKSISSTMWESLLLTVLDECCAVPGSPSHLTLVERILSAGGMELLELEKLQNSPGNIAAIALYRDISMRGAGCHMVGAGVVEYYYADLCPSIFTAYTNKYGFSDYEAETYKIHGSMDKEHADRAFTILQEATSIYGKKIIQQSVRDAFIATSLHYDGMFQAACNHTNYWNGGGQ